MGDRHGRRSRDRDVRARRDGPVTHYAWDYSPTNATTTITPASGTAMLALTAAPQFFALP